MPEPTTGIPSYELDLNEDEQAVDYIDRIDKGGSEFLESWYARAAINLAWSQGKQFTQYKLRDADSAGMVINDPRYSGPSRKPYVATNFMRRYLLSRIANVTAAPFTWRCRPMKSGDSADEITASVLDKILPMWWESLDVDGQEFTKALWILFATNIVFAHVYWDTDGDDEEIVITPKERNAKVREFLSVKNKEDAEDLRDMGDAEIFDAFIESEFPDIDPSMMSQDDDGTIRMSRGNLALDWLTGFDVIEDLSENRWEDKGEVLIKRRISVKRVKRQYGDKAEHVKGETTEGYSGHRRLARDERLVNEPMSSVFETTEVRTLWRRPQFDDDYPKGLKIVVCEGKILDSTDFPFEHGHLPVIPIHADPDPNEFRPMGTIDDILNLQDTFNHLDSQIISHIDLTVDPNVLNPTGCLRNRDLFLTVTPGINDYDKELGIPTPWPMEPLAPHVIREKEMIGAQLEELASITDPTQGRPTSQAISGLAISTLNERYDLLFKPVRKAIGQGIEKIAQQVVALFAQFESRKTEYWTKYGVDNKAEMLTLTGKSLVSQSQNGGRAAITKFDISLEIGEPRNRTTVIIKIRELIEIGILNPIRDADLIAQAVSDGVLPDIDHTRRDRLRASEENEEILVIVQEVLSEEMEEKDAYGMSEQMEPGLGDDHAIHIKGHLEFAKSGRINDIEPREDRARGRVILQGMIEKHVQKHQSAMMKAAMSRAVMERQISEITDGGRKGNDGRERNRARGNERRPGPGTGPRPGSGGSRERSSGRTF